MCPNRSGLDRILTIVRSRGVHCPNDVPVYYLIPKFYPFTIPRIFLRKRSTGLRCG